LSSAWILKYNLPFQTQINVNHFFCSNKLFQLNELCYCYVKGDDTIPITINKQTADLFISSQGTVFVILGMSWFTKIGDIR
jgi:hypothetical protein